MKLLIILSALQKVDYFYLIYFFFINLRGKQTFPYLLNLYLKHHVVLFCAPTIANFYPENRKLSTFLLSHNDRLV